MAFVVGSVFYYRRLQTGSAFARILPTGGEGFQCLEPASSPIHHLESPLLCTCHGPRYLKTLSVFIL